MACGVTALAGVALDCGSVGGLKKIYVASVTDVSGITVDSVGQVTGITATAGSFKEFNFKKGNANFSSETAVDEKASSSVVTTTLTMQFNKMDATLRNEVLTLTKVPTYFIALDNNGLYWLIGRNSYCVSNATANSGAERADSNGYIVTVTSETSELPAEVKESVMTTLLA